MSFHKCSHFNFFSQTIDRCLICDRELCKACLQKVDELTLCKKHFKLYTKFHWIIVSKAISNPEDSENGVRLIAFKEHLSVLGICCFVKTSYFIDEEFNQIGTQMHLVARSVDLPQIKREAVSFPLIELSQDF